MKNNCKMKNSGMHMMSNGNIVQKKNMIEETENLDKRKELEMKIVDSLGHLYSATKKAENEIQKIENYFKEYLVQPPCSNSSTNDAQLEILQLWLGESWNKIKKQEYKVQ